MADASGIILSSGTNLGSPGAGKYRFYINTAGILIQVDSTGAEKQISTNPNTFSSLTIGDVPGGDYVEFEATGAEIRHGDARSWDDVAMVPHAIQSTGLLLPAIEVVANDGVIGTGVAYHFDGVDGQATLSDYAALDSAAGHYSVSFWVKPYSDTGMLAFRDNFIEIRKSWNDLEVIVDGSSTWATGVVANNSIYHVAVTVEDTGSRSRVIIYVNGSEVANQSLWGAQLGSSSEDWLFGGVSGDFADCDMDELQGYNITLSAAQVLELYNSGDGIETVPTGVTEATDLIFQFSDTTSNLATLGTGEDISIAGGVGSTTSLIAGSGSSGSAGITAMRFDPGVTMGYRFVTQFKHGYAESTDIFPHVHWMTKLTNGGEVRWGIEYIWVNINGTVSSTDTIEASISQPSVGAVHRVSDIGVIPGAGKTISSNIQGRIYRRGDDALDTCPDPVYLSDADFHAQHDTPGSRLIWTK